MSGWRELACEIDAGRAAGRSATLWLRDDDAVGATPALARLLSLAERNGMPVALAAIPALAGPSLAEAVARSAQATVVQHGFAHRNHAPPGERNWELGAHRPAATCLAELERGRAMLERLAGARFLPVLVPPWNRIAGEVVDGLGSAGIRGFSAFGPRPTPSPAAGLVQVNTHVDLIAWRRGRCFIGAAEALARLVEHLRARRERRVDPDEPSGLLTHHLDMDEAAFAFVEELAERTRARPGAVWLDVRAAFGWR